MKLPEINCLEDRGNLSQGGGPVGTDGVLSPLGLECWICAYRLDDSEFMEEECIKLKPILLSIALELIEKPVECIFSDAERDIPQKNIYLLEPYVDRPVDPGKYRYQLDLYSSSEKIGEKNCDTTFVRCIVDKSNNMAACFPVAMDVARSIEDAIFGVSASGIRYPVPVPANLLCKIAPEFIHDSSMICGEFWLDILLNPGGDDRITEKWLADNHYDDKEPTFRLIGLT